MIIKLLTILILTLSSMWLRTAHASLPPPRAELCCIAHKNYLFYVQGPAVIVDNKVKLPDSFFYAPPDGYESEDDYDNACLKRMKLFNKHGMPFVPTDDEAISLDSGKKLITASGLEIFMEQSLLMVRVPISLPDTEIVLVLDFAAESLSTDPYQVTHDGKPCFVIDYRRIASERRVPVVYAPLSFKALFYPPFVRQSIAQRMPWHDYEMEDYVAPDYRKLDQRIYQIDNPYCPLRLTVWPSGKSPQKHKYYAPSFCSRPWQHLVKGNQKWVLSSSALYNLDICMNWTEASCTWHDAYRAGDYDALFYMGLYSQMILNSAASAHEHYYELIKRQRYSPGLYNNLGVALIQQKFYDQGLRFLRKAAVQGLPEAVYNLGILYASGTGVVKMPMLGQAYQSLAAHIFGLPMQQPSVNTEK